MLGGRAGYGKTMQTTTATNMIFSSSSSDDMYHTISRLSLEKRIRRDGVYRWYSSGLCVWMKSITYHTVPAVYHPYGKGTYHMQGTNRSWEGGGEPAMWPRIWVTNEWDQGKKEKDTQVRLYLYGSYAASEYSGTNHFIYDYLGSTLYNSSSCRLYCVRSVAVLFFAFFVCEVLCNEHRESTQHNEPRTATAWYNPSCNLPLAVVCTSARRYFGTWYFVLAASSSQ